MVQVVEVANEVDRQKAVLLLRAFPKHQREYYTANLDSVLRYFEPDAYEQEISNLQVYYGPPKGCVLLAYDEGEPAGVVCLRPLSTEACEMKRLFVPVAHRRKGIAQALCETLIKVARDKGFTVMRLDTGFFMTESQALYRKLGFAYTSAYQPVREELQDQLVFMELHL